MLNTVYALPVGIFLMLLTAYLVRDPGKKSLTDRLYERLALGRLKLELTAAQGGNYVSLMLQNIFKSYHHAELYEERVRIGQQRVMDLKGKINDHSMDRRRKGFHIKISE